MIRKYNNISLMIGLPGLIIINPNNPLLFAGGTILLIVGLMYYAKAKGRSAYWGFFGVLHLLGVVVLAALKDKDESKEILEGKKSFSILLYVLLGFALLGGIPLIYNKMRPPLPHNERPNRKGELVQRESPSFVKIAASSFFAAKGQALYDGGRYEEAVGPLEEAIRIRPEHGKAHYYLALSYERLGYEEKAAQLITSYLNEMKQTTKWLGSMDKNYIAKCEMRENQIPSPELPVAPSYKKQPVLSDELIRKREEAQSEINKGNDLFVNAKRSSYDRKLYREACEQYWGAYEIYKDFFGLKTIRNAYNACDGANDSEKKVVFEKFYSKFTGNT